VCIFDIVTLTGEYEVILCVNSVEAMHVWYIYIMNGEVFCNGIGQCDIFLYKTLLLFKMKLY